LQAPLPPLPPPGAAPAAGAPPPGSPFAPHLPTEAEAAQRLAALPSKKEATEEIRLVKR